jgi:hypothetical protein
MHSPPDPATETLLISVHGMAEKWLLHYAQKNVLMIPGNLRAGLQMFEGHEDVNGISQHSTYTLQHDPKSILPELKKMISFAYLRGILTKGGMNTDPNDDFFVPEFLKDLLLVDDTASPTCHPFIVEFCLMSPFRVKHDSISMISCDTLSPVFSKMASVCKAGVCSFILSYANNNAFSSHGPELITKIRQASVLHILSPFVRQLREMNGRLPKRRKTTLDMLGNITVDQFRFLFDDWSTVVPRLIFMMKSAIGKLAVGNWWETVVDVAAPVRVLVDATNGEMTISGVVPLWNHGSMLPLDEFDSFTAMIETAFHGFGGGSARFTKLSEPTMFHCLFVNQAIYYSL